MRKVAALALGLAALSLFAGCSGGEVKAEDIDDYQSAGRPAGEKVEKATPSSDTGNGANDANARPDR